MEDREPEFMLCGKHKNEIRIVGFPPRLTLCLFTIVSFQW